MYNLVVDNEKCYAENVFTEYKTHKRNRHVTNRYYSDKKRVEVFTAGLSVYKYYKSPS